MGNFTVYMHTTPNGKRYIGITCRKPEYRWNGGCCYTRSPHFYKAILEYGWDNIRHEILFTGLTKDEATHKEIDLIRIYETTDPSKGYNITRGGGGAKGVKVSDETKAKHSETMRRRMENPEYREQVTRNLSLAHSTEEIRTKRAAAIKKAYSTPERRKQLSERSTGEKNGFYGRHHTPETRAILAEKSRGKCGAAHPRSKPVLQLDMEGKVLRCYESGHLASLATGIEYRTLNTCLRGITKSCGGFRWQYEGVV